MSMQDAVPIQVPGHFAEDLAGTGFEEARPSVFRGGGVEPVLTLVATGAGLAADAATILVAKDAASDFISRLRSWMTRRARVEPGGELVIEISWRSAGSKSHARIVARWAAVGVAPEVDTEALASLLNSVFATRIMSEGRPNAAPPG